MTLVSISSNVCRATSRCISRFLSTSASKSTAYDSDGKTVATILNKELGSNLLVDSYSITGFRLNNGMYVVGPVAVFPRTVVGWNVADDVDIKEESLSLFTLLEPKLDLLVIGYGSRTFSQGAMEKEVLKIRRNYNLNIELLPTDRAIATYNFLASESRWVAAALIPPKSVNLTDSDMGVVRKKREDEAYMRRVEGS